MILTIFATDQDLTCRREPAELSVSCSSAGTPEVALEESIEVLLDFARVHRLMKRHGIDRSTATQIVNGQLCIDKVLHRRRRKQHLAKYRSRCMLAKAAGDGRPRVFALHGQEIVIARVKAVGQYDVSYLPLGPDLKPCGDLVTQHKLKFKFGAYFDHASKLQSAIEICRFTADSAETIVKPQDRYYVSDKKLYGWVDASSRICVKTLEGEMVKGTLSWIGRWELGLDVYGAELIVFRHALANIQGFRWGSSKDD